jgi:hypothetical protein
MQLTTTMKTKNHAESTYALLVRSEQEESSLPETFVYLLLILCTAFTMWSSAHQRFQLPAIALMQSASVADTTSQVRGI